MCAVCVAQGITYMGGALAGLQVMGARAKYKRGRGADSSDDTTAEGEAEQADEETVGASH
ncbi:MAG TPA: hypothetical protein VGJ86_06140 [Acidimicrobiales bacterium]|jgi:hypothetical protein